MMNRFIYGHSFAFQQLIEQLTQAARTAWPILLLGETGVGKECLAQLIHEKSPRKGQPFVPVNCGAISPQLFESELFGHEKGAFSGAIVTSRGLARTAHRGSLFLDELGELPTELQVKLLRFLDSGEVRSVGGTRFEKVDVRVLAATNADLFRAVAAGSFRRDLFERLSVFQFRIPPLRERHEDLRAIAEEQLKMLGTRYEESFLQELQRFDWPGNVRQLKNVLIRAALFSNSALKASTVRAILDEEARRCPSENPALDYRNLSLAEIEREVILDRLKICRGNRKQAAKELGIAKSTLHEKLRKWKTATGGEPFNLVVWSDDDEALVGSG